jgi:phage shock protein C
METTGKLYRSRTDRQLAGVCGGLAEFFNVDPTLVRILFVIGTLMGGPGLLLYIILWLIMPED